MDETLLLSGIHGRTGRSLTGPLSLARVAALARGEDESRSVRRWLDHLRRLFSEPHLGLPVDADPTRIEDAGWAVVFHSDEDPAVKGALEPLVRHRRQAAGPRARVLEFRPGDTWPGWLHRHGVAAGSVMPEKVPYYLLLVGGPDRIPFDFQHLLAVEYAVGRLGFATAQDYERYVSSLLAAERGDAPGRSRTVAFFAPRNDAATALSEGRLVGPLAAAGGVVERRGFDVLTACGPRARREDLAELVDGHAPGGPPAVLFTASHGVGWDAGDPAQEDWQGALVCQDWPGSGALEPRRHCFGAVDVGDGARVHGLVAFLFACYGAGTPEHDGFLRPPGRPPARIAPRPFLAALPRRLLTHRRGAALAVIGHVDRAWSYSFVSPHAGAQLLPFENTLGSLVTGCPVGHALRDFRQRFATLSTEISHLLEGERFGVALGKEDSERLAHAWLERNDARNYVVLGDPAARLSP